MKLNLLESNSLGKNFVFQIFYDLITLFVPLLVSPYLTRTLGSSSLGVYSYTYSIAYYFVVIAMLGINRHGQRVIAERRSDQKTLRTTFWSLYAVHMIASLLSLLAYIFYFICICNSDKTIAFIQILYVSSAAFNITWLFYGLEKFEIISLRNIVIKVAETLCIFLFVHKPADVGIYTFIMCVSVLLENLVVVPMVVTAIPPIRFSIKDMAEHIKPLLTLFTAVLAVSLYTMFDKTLLGILATKDDVAFYEYSDKIIKVPNTFLTAVGTVIFPRACSLAAENRRDEMNRVFKKCVILISFIGFAGCFGLAAVAKTFAVLFYGETFAICGEVIISMCPLLLIIGLGEALRQCYIYPYKMDSTMVKVLCANAAINIALSIFFIPRLGIYGAVIGTISAETFGLIVEIFISRHFISVKDLFKDILPFTVIGAVMYISVRFIAGFIDGTVSALLLQITVGAVVYCSLTLIYGIFFNQTLKNLILDAVHAVQSYKYKGKAF